MNCYNELLHFLYIFTFYIHIYIIVDNAQFIPTALRRSVDFVYNFLAFICSLIHIPIYQQAYVVLQLALPLSVYLERCNSTNYCSCLINCCSKHGNELFIRHLIVLRKVSLLYCILKCILIAFLADSIRLYQLNLCNWLLHFSEAMRYRIIWLKKLIMFVLNVVNFLFGLINFFKCTT